MAYIPDNGSVAAWIQSNNSSVFTVQKPGSVMAVSGSFTPVANQSVSGTVGASIIGTIPVTQVTSPWVITGSIQGSFSAGNSSVQVLNFPTNQSISGTVGASIIGAPPANVFVGGALATTSNPLPVSPPASGFFPVVLNTSTNASVITVGSPVANQSVSGTVQTDVRGSVATVIIGGSIAASFTPPANQSVSGTVTTNQGTNPWIITGSVQGNFVGGNSSVQVLNFPTNQSVSGAVSVSNFPTTQNVSGSVAAWLQSTNASIITVGGATGNSSVQVLNFPANQSVSGAVSISNFPTTQNVSGSVVSFQGTNPWIITGSVQTSLTPAANQSVSGTVGASVIGHAPVFIVGGSVATATTNSSVMLLGSTAVIGSVMTLQGTNPWIITGSVQGDFGGGNSSVQVLNFPTNQSVSGTVAVTQSTTPWNIAGSVASFQAGTQITSVSGQVTVVSSLAGGIFPISGSVAATITNTNVNVSGSVVAFQGGTVITSVSGTILASVTGSVSIVPASVITGNASLVGAASVQVFSAASGVRNYVTAFLVSNTGAATTLVTFTDGDASVIGKTIAPAGGGSNAPALATPMIPSVNKVVNVSAQTATSVLHVWVGGYRAP